MPAHTKARRPRASEVERPANCGECARMQRFHAIIDGVEYDGGCPEFGIHVKNTDVCHPNVGQKKGGAK